MTVNIVNKDIYAQTCVDEYECVCSEQKEQHVQRCGNRSWHVCFGNFRHSWESNQLALLVRVGGSHPYSVVFLLLHSDVCMVPSCDARKISFYEMP